ncbi:MAG: IS5 family transposase [Rhodoplanes sp.]
MIESLPLTTGRLYTFEQQRMLTNATSFFFERDERLFLVTSRHVMFDEPSKHFPDRIEIELHTDPENMARSSGFSLTLYRDGKAAWRQGLDSAGEVDVAAIEIERSALPESTVYRAFTPKHLLPAQHQVEIGSSLLIVGFPLGFHDTLHHMPVARHAVIASSFGLRFQGHGYFLTDARTHRGTRACKVVGRRGEPDRRRHRQPVGKDRGKRRASRVPRGQKDQGTLAPFVTDTQGNLVGLVVHEADIQDRDGAPRVLSSISALYPWLRHVFADGGYAGDKLRDALKGKGSWVLEIIKRSDAAKGFEVLPRRWVVERTFAWLGRCRRLAKDFEATIASAVAWVLVAHVRTLTRRIART